MTEIYNDSGIPERELTLQYKTPEGFVKTVSAVDTSANEFTAEGDVTTELDEGKTIEVLGSTGNDQKYTINSFSFNSTSNITTISVEEDVTDSTADGKIFYDLQTPSVADGTEIKIFAESIKEIFQKEPMTQSIQKGQETHFKGDKTLINDTLDSKHKFEVTGWVYSGKQGKHSLEENTLGINSEDEAQKSSEIIQAETFGNFIPLGDTEIIHDTETVTALTSDNGDPVTLTRGIDYEMDYNRGLIKFKKGKLDTATQVSTFAGLEVSSREVINDGFEVSYDFHSRANNISRLIRRMSQLGGTFVMRLDSTQKTAPGDNESSRGYPIIANKTNITGKSEKPDEFKLEMELTRGTEEQ